MVTVASWEKRRSSCTRAPVNLGSHSLDKKLPKLRVFIVGNGNQTLAVAPYPTKLQSHLTPVRKFLYKPIPTR